MLIGVGRGKLTMRRNCANNHYFITIVYVIVENTNRNLMKPNIIEKNYNCVTFLIII